jgi:hypothetical protein
LAVRGVPVTERKRTLTDLGTDHEDRPITYDSATGRFAIGGIHTTVDRIVAYDRGKQINWASDEMRAWAHECEGIRRENVAAHQVAAAEKTREEASARAQADAVAREATERARRRKVAGYDPAVVVAFAGMIEGLAWTVAVLLALGAASNGVLVGLIFVRDFPGGILLLPILWGVTALVMGGILVFVARAVRQMILTVVQIEHNTRPEY